ncbi:MAG: glycoside hydrolase [Opitutaceae bacterium]|nr:glycoside hydrolase [Opitutaceae bacterium]
MNMTTHITRTTRALRALRAAAAGFIMTASLAAAPAGEDPAHWRLSETPATVIINPAGDLATGRAYQGTPNIVASATGRRVFAIWYGNGADDDDHKGQGHAWECTDNYVMAAYGDARLDFGNNRVRIVIRSPHKRLVRCFDPCGWREPSGRVWLAWCQSTGEYDFHCRYFEKKNAQWSRHGSTWGIYTDDPDAPEPKWSAPRRLFDGNMINDPTFLKDGTGLYPVCQFIMKDIQDMHSMKEGAGAWISRDGFNFEQIGNIRFPDSRYAEHMFVEKNDGSIWCVGRREPGEMRLQRWSNAQKRFINLFKPTDGIVEAVSTDGGRTFGPSTFSKIPGIGSRTYIARLKSGNLLLMKSWANDELWLAGKPKFGDGPKPQRRAVVAYISKDDGKSWEGGYYLFDVRKTTVPTDKKFTQYPDGSQAVTGENDGFIYIIWDYSRFDEPEIHAAKLTEDDILAGKIVTKGSIADAIVNKGPKTEKPPAEI